MVKWAFRGTVMMNSLCSSEDVTHPWLGLLFHFLLLTAFLYDFHPSLNDAASVEVLSVQHHLHCCNVKCQRTLCWAGMFQIWTTALKSHGILPQLDLSSALLMKCHFGQAVRLLGTSKPLSLKRNQWDLPLSQSLFGGSDKTLKPHPLTPSIVF